jgi:hypothetical protein
MRLARASLCVFAAGACLASPVWAQNALPNIAVPPPKPPPDFETSWRLGIWSGARLSTPDDDPVLQGEVWVRGRKALTPTIDLKLNGWVAADPIGTGKADVEVREAAFEARFGAVKIVAGRQIFIWGRADKINPTDVLGTRDYRRLTEDDVDQRLGLLALSASSPLAGGTLNLHWVPEFRPTTLPQDFDRLGLPVDDLGAKKPEQQFAVRYERFGNRVDWSASIARVADRIPWLDLALTPNGQPQLQLKHPDLTMIGADFATTVGKFGLRGEAAYYDYKKRDLGRSAARRPYFQAVLGIDRDFANQINVIVQAGIRQSDQVSDAIGPLVTNNTSIQAAWQDAVGAAFIRVRKGFKDDRGSFEAALGAYQRGGNFASARFNLPVRDGVRVILQGEHYWGPGGTYFGRLSNNSLISMSVRFGF